MEGMKVPRTLLNKWITLTETESAIAASLTEAGLEVDSVDNHVFDISLTPNLSHAMSVLGVARELSALFDIPLLPHQIAPFVVEDTRTDELISIEIENSADCPRYMAAIIEGVTVAPSPAWFVEELQLLGIRPLNNVVDVTNYVMHMIGQPLHAFDLQKIAGKTLYVRHAHKGESLTLLDERTLHLTPEMQIIADQQGPLALAGVMGGQNSGISESTTSLLLESASFSSSTTRKSSRKSATITESSKRFERGHDPHLCLQGLEYAISLIQKLAGGKLARDFIDLKAHDISAKTVVVRLERINKLVGFHFSLSEIEALFKRLHFTITHLTDTTLHVQVPTWRVDITSEIDLVEEAIRLFGVNNLPRVKKPFLLGRLHDSPPYRLAKEFEELSLRHGLMQLLTCDLVGPKDVGEGEHLVKVMNASCQEQSILRPSLLPGLLGSLKHNIDFKEPDLQGFEIGRVHYKMDNKFVEEEKLGIILHGKARETYWSSSAREVDFFDLKGLVISILSKYAPLDLRSSTLADFHPHQQMAVFAAGEQVAILGQIHPRLSQLATPVFFAEINLSSLGGLAGKTVTYKPLAKWPAIERDLTITLKEETTLEMALGAVKSCRSELLEDVKLVNIYRHDDLGKNLKNMSLRFYFRSSHKTLSSEEAEKEFARLSHALESLYATKN